LEKNDRAGGLDYVLKDIDLNELLFRELFAQPFCNTVTNVGKIPLPKKMMCCFMAGLSRFDCDFGIKLTRHIVLMRSQAIVIAPDRPPTPSLL